MCYIYSCICRISDTSLCNLKIKFHSFQIVQQKLCILGRLPHLLCMHGGCTCFTCSGLGHDSPFMNPPKPPFLAPCRRKHNHDSPSLKKQWMCMGLQRNAPTSGMLLDECRKLNKEMTRTGTKRKTLKREFKKQHSKPKPQVKSQ